MPHVFLCGRADVASGVPDGTELGADRNVLLQNLLGAHTHPVRHMPYVTGLRLLMEERQKWLHTEEGSST